MLSWVGLAAVATSVAAQEANARPSGQNGDVIAVEVLPGWREADSTHIAALKLTLAHGWKTYWRAPGDAGIPPDFDWSASENVAEVVPHWPVPDIFTQNGMRSIGYDDEVVIPLHVLREDPAKPIHLRAEVSLGICEEICIPAFVSLDALLPAEGSADQDILTALGDRPLTEDEARVTHVACLIAPSEDGLGLTVEITMPRIGRGEAAAIETSDPSIWVAEPRLRRDGDTLTAQTELIRYNAAPLAVDRSGIRVTVFGSNTAVDIQGCSTR
ncbi:MAG: protein-disulfide reductase DsbD domain-containing protein [Pseudomonadota bacterium]